MEAFSQATDDHRQGYRLQIGPPHIVSLLPTCLPRPRPTCPAACPPAHPTPPHPDPALHQPDSSGRYPQILDTIKNPVGTLGHLQKELGRSLPTTQQ